MKMNKKGFTLIELLAIIVILAIIALIAVPVVLNIINKAQNEANERSVESYANALKTARMSYMLDHSGMGPETETDESKKSEAISVIESTALAELSGNKPSNCTVSFDASGILSLSDCEINGSKYDYNHTSGAYSKVS